MSANRYQCRVLHGAHNEYGKTYHRGEVVNSRSDLRKMNKPGAKKFEFMGMVDEGAIEPEAITINAPVRDFPSEDTLSNMTIPELRRFAEQEEIELGSAKSKTEILEAIRAASN